MKRLAWCILIVCLMAGCGPSPVEPMTTPLPPTPSFAPSPTPLPSATPIPPSPTPPPQAMWWDYAVFYEVFVRSFFDSDGDGQGDLPGLIEKLDYLNDGDPGTDTDLGVTGLWMMPLFVSPSYHGYDVVDYRTVNPDYGTNDDFRRLVDEAHKRGLRVIVDMVINHTSDQHPWFLDSASGPDAGRRDWYIWSETDPGYRGPDGQKVWHEKNGAYYYGLFWHGMPDLNLENAGVTEELYDVARFWLEDMGADGFRLDAARHLIEEGEVQEHTPATYDWLARFYTHTKRVDSEMLAVGEIWDVSDLVSTYIGDELDLAFEFSLAKAILLSVNEGRVTPVASAMKEIQRLYPEGGAATFLANHDQNRVMDALSRDPDKAKLAATMLLALPGVPFVYYGEEIGMTGSKPDELIRTPMQWTSGPQAGFTDGTPWEAVNEGYETLNVEDQAADPDSLLNHYRSLIALRRAHPALGSGGYVQVESADSKVYAFLRQAQGEQVLVVINMAGKPATDYALSQRKGPLAPGDYEATDLMSSGEVAPLPVDGEGSFEGYQPQGELPGQTALVLLLVSGGE